MIKKIAILTGAAVIATTLISAPSQAALLDFTKQTFIGASGPIAGTNYTISVVGGTLSTAQTQDGNTCPPGDLECFRDGIGVSDGNGNQDDDDEISSRNGQSLTITFDDVVRITGLAFLDLFMDDDSDNRENAHVAYTGGSDNFLSDPNQVRFDGSSGFLNVTGLNILTNFLTFTVADGLLQDREYGDFALASVSVSAVPLPPAVVMFGVALGGVGFMARRRRKSGSNTRSGSTVN